MAWPNSGIASKHPTTIQLMTRAISPERTTISHCPRLTIGLKTLVSGTANAGTALISLNRFFTFVSVLSMVESVLKLRKDLCMMWELYGFGVENSVADGEGIWSWDSVCNLHFLMSQRDCVRSSGRLGGG